MVDNGNGLSLRIVERLFIILLVVVCGFIWTSLSELKGQIHTLQSNRSDTAVQMATMKSEQGRYNQDIAEIKGTLLGLSKQVQDLTIAVGRSTK